MGLSAMLVTVYNAARLWMLAQLAGDALGFLDVCGNLVVLGIVFVLVFTGPFGRALTSVLGFFTETLLGKCIFYAGVSAASLYFIATSFHV